MDCGAGGGDKIAACVRVGVGCGPNLGRVGVGQHFPGGQQDVTFADDGQTTGVGGDGFCRLVVAGAHGNQRIHRIFLNGLFQRPAGHLPAVNIGHLRGAQQFAVPALGQNFFRAGSQGGIVAIGGFVGDGGSVGFLPGDDLLNADVHTVPGFQGQVMGEGVLRLWGDI